MFDLMFALFGFVLFAAGLNVGYMGKETENHRYLKVGFGLMLLGGGCMMGYSLIVGGAMWAELLRWLT